MDRNRDLRLHVLYIGVALTLERHLPMRLGRFRAQIT
jgi:hypothetical protein